MPKMVQFGEFLKTQSLRSNRVTRQVSFNRSKIGGKCQNWKIQIRHSRWFSNTVPLYCDLLYYLFLFKRHRVVCKFLWGLLGVATIEVLSFYCSSSLTMVEWYNVEVSLILYVTLLWMTLFSTMTNMRQSIRFKGTLRIYRGKKKMGKIE